MPTSTSSLRVRYAETDRMGVVYYANYLVWFEVARADLIRALGRTYRDLEDDDGLVLPVIEAHCEYRQAARYDEEIDVRASAAVLSPIRVRFDYEVFRRTDEQPLASGYTMHAALDERGKPRRLPEWLRKALT